eukprot:TRINITY_DN3856_c0_g1_i1.p1 TRINITY_DN3856_c0_g1~~TRINITY_DN3856_c0_g1_i1.p1  ORF type:complete len:141 (+),score=10.21 TRINITY_DN3856_c0_g1_i1:22-423(+)
MTTSLVILLSLVFLTHGQATYNEVKDFCAGFTDCNKCATAIGPTVSTSTSTSSSSPCIWCLNAGKNKVSTSSSSRFRTTTTTPAPPSSGDPFSPPVGSCNDSVRTPRTSMSINPLTFRFRQSELVSVAQKGIN